MFGAGTGSFSIALGIFAKSVGFMVLPLCFLGSQVSVSTFRLLSVMF
jgi:hypothetical protein